MNLLESMKSVSTIYLGLRLDSQNSTTDKMDVIVGYLRQSLFNHMETETTPYDDSRALQIH